MPQVFGCPNCQNPFQVPDDAAGKAFQCPTCQSTVEVPGFADAAETPNGSSPLEQAPSIFYCPLCSGQFGVEESMLGQKVACPHCAELVEIEPDFEEVPELETVDESSTIETVQRKEAEQEEPVAEEPLPPPEPVFEPQSVDHLLPPRCGVPDPQRFPTRLGSDTVILPDGDGGYQSVEANIVTITHNGQEYELKRLTPEQRRRRKAIHNTITIGIAFGLIYFTLRLLGVFS